MVEGKPGLTVESPDMIDPAPQDDKSQSLNQSIKLSDNDEVREQLRRNSEPMGLTDFFIRRPCVAIVAPYLILIIFAAIAFS